MHASEIPMRSAVIVSKEEVSVSIAKTLHLSSFLVHAFKSSSDKTAWYSFFDFGALGISLPELLDDFIHVLNSRDANNLFNSS